MVHPKSKRRLCSKNGRCAIDVYQCPYDPLRPMVCIDETNKQLIKQTRILCVPGQPQRVDYEYERMGVVDVFMIFEPLAGRRVTLVTIATCEKFYYMFVLLCCYAKAN